MVQHIRENTSTTSSQHLRNTLLHHHHKGDSIALWRLPKRDKAHLITTLTTMELPAKTPLEPLQSGFVMAPFDSESNFFFIKADQHYTFKQPATEEKSVLDHNKTTHLYTTYVEAQQQESIAHYLNLVNKALTHIKEGQFQKTVLSRRKIISMPNEKKNDAIDLFQKLCLKYPHAFISLVSTPELGTWIGASPELLLSVDRNMNYRTVALAGTQAFKPNMNSKAIMWANKEIREQAMVSTYIEDTLKKTGLNKFKKDGPESWRAGNIIHLKTDFTIPMYTNTDPKRMSAILKALHPTPATCGFPQKIAKAFLYHNEGFNRQFYSGYLGPVAFQHETHIYVNLRCMQWAMDRIVFYAGAGVIQGSVAEKEWEETEMKINTLLDLIQE